MGALFHRIAREIGDRVEAAIDLRQIFRMQPSDAVELIRACKSVLEHWFSTYMQVNDPA
jgi:dynein heavy chain